MTLKWPQQLRAEAGGAQLALYLSVSPHMLNSREWGLRGRRQDLMGTEGEEERAVDSHFAARVPSMMVWRVNKYSQRCGSCAGEVDPPSPDPPACWTLHAERFQLPSSDSNWMLDGAFKSLVVRNVKHPLSIGYFLPHNISMNVKYKYIFKIFKVSNWTIRSPGSIIWNFQHWTILLWSFCVDCLSSFPPLWLLWFPPAVSKRPWFCLISSSLVLDSSSWLLLPLVSSTSELRCWFHDFWDQNFCCHSFSLTLNTTLHTFTAINSG